MVAMISKTGGPYPEHVSIPDGLPVQGIIRCGEVMTLGKERLRDFQMALDVFTIQRMNRGLAAALSLPT